MSEPALTAWGRRVGAQVQVPVVLALRGELGAGKSVLARAIARGAGVRGPMPSPTFNLLYRYDAPARAVEVYHIDLYRLNRAAEVWDLGWRELGDAGQIVIIEWPERAESLLPADRWDITLDFATQPDLRELRGIRHGDAPALPEP